ncbi:MAG TPA: nitronate monooxygenase [Bryobacteraceae bacterium]|nr:nitronate monooxygenase [Bryobacteraceae bacterium]
MEKRQREFLAIWGPPVPPEAGDTSRPDFEAQCKAMLDARPKVISSIMGLYPAEFVAELKAKGVLLFATATTVAEAKAAEEAGADAIVAQGMEAGGHRGAFDPDRAEHQLVGLMALLPQVVDSVDVPVIATGGIADARGIAAALILGASAVQMGTGLLRTPEAMTHPSYADRIGRAEAHETTLTRAFSGRLGRSIATAYVRAALDGPLPAPTLFSADSPRSCGNRRAKLETLSGCKCGLDNPPNWLGQNPPARLSSDCGTILCNF